MILGKIGSKTGVVETELFAHITLYVIFDRFMKVKICPSNSACWFLLVAVPAKPTGPIKFSNVLGDEVTLNWSPPKKDGGSPITSYKLEISEDGKTWTPLDASEAIKYVAKGLKDGQKYFFKVAAINEVGEGEYLVSDVVVPKKPIGKISSNILLQ